MLYIYVAYLYIYVRICLLSIIHTFTYANVTLPHASLFSVSCLFPNLPLWKFTKACYIRTYIAVHLFVYHSMHRGPLTVGTDFPVDSCCECLVCILRPNNWSMLVFRCLVPHVYTRGKLCSEVLGSHKSPTCFYKRATYTS